MDGVGVHQVVDCRATKANPSLDLLDSQNRHFLLHSTQQIGLLAFSACDA